MKDEDQAITNILNTNSDALALLTAAIARQLDANQLVLDLQGYLQGYEANPNHMPGTRLVLRQCMQQAQLVAQQQSHLRKQTPANPTKQAPHPE